MHMKIIFQEKATQGKRGDIQAKINLNIIVKQNAIIFSW